MTPTQLLLVLRARWRLATWVFLLVVGMVGAVTLLRAPQYTATASMVLDVKSPDPIAGVVLPGMTVVGYMATQLGVMQSERVALRALQALQTDQDPALHQQWLDDTRGLGDFRSWLADGMLRRLQITPMRDSNVVTVAYTSTDPIGAAAAANAFVAAYIDTTLDLRVEPAKQYNNFFDGRTRQMRDELEQAQKRLSTYQQKKGIVASDERLDVENLRLAELSSQLVALQAVANESGGRQSQSGANAERMQEVLNNPLLVGLNTELARLEGRLNEVTARLGDSHPQVLELRANVSQLRERIDSETRRVAGSLTVNNNVNQTRLAQLRASVDEQRNKLLRLKGQRDESAVLLRDVENAQRAYDMVVSRATQSGVESQATQTNVSVLKQATPPPRPSSPRLRLTLLVAVFIGMLLATCVVLLREHFDRRLRTTGDVTQGLRQPLLGALPANSRSRATRSASLLGGGSVMRALTRPRGR
jgi:succinoglycan biosynthesis transport protein ExoP